MKLEELKEYAGYLGKGLIAQFIPNIAKGIITEFLKGANVTSATGWVQNNVVLWDRLKPEEQDALKGLAKKTNGLDWLDANWVIEAIKEDLPAVASLFLGWKKANNWLVRQVEIIKQKTA